MSPDVPTVDYGGQGGFGDVIVAPDFSKSGLVYLSWVEAGADDTRGAVVGRAKLEYQGSQPKLVGLQKIWEQNPQGHRTRPLWPSPRILARWQISVHRLWRAAEIRSGAGYERQSWQGAAPLPRWQHAEGQSVLRCGQSGASQIWSLGHRNPLGLTFDDKGQLWNQEMGPRHGDELNLVKRGANYGYPKGFEWQSLRRPRHPRSQTGRRL
jgi:glucose/arabinose dehydrogenase